MILRSLLLIFILGCLLFIILIKNIKLKPFLILIMCTLFLVLVYTFSTAHITVKSVINQNLRMEYVVNNFPYNNNLDSLKRTYTIEKSDSMEFSNFIYIKYSIDEIPSDRDVYDLIYNFSVEDGYMCGLDVADKIIFKSLTPLLTSKKTENNVIFWFLPTMIEPYNPNSYFLKGCFYGEYYYNVFAWYQEGFLNVIYERCSSDIGKTDEENFVNFVQLLNTENNQSADGSMIDKK